MKKLTVLSLTLMFSIALAGVTLAGEAEKVEPVTLEGKIVCAKCTLKEEGRKVCQNVLVVQDGDDTKMLYLANTEASEAFGHVCADEKTVRATGKVSEKDGKTWLAAREIVSLESKN